MRPGSVARIARRAAIALAIGIGAAVLALAAGLWSWQTQPELPLGRMPSVPDRIRPWDPLNARAAPPIPYIPLDGMEPTVRAQFERAIGEAVHEQSGDALGRLGMLAHAYGLHSAALHCYARAAAREWKEPRWRYYQGVILAELGRDELAAIAFTSVLQAEPDHAAALRRLGELDLRQGRAEQALAQLSRAADLAGTAAAPQVHCSAGEALLRLGRVNEAIERFERALAQSGGHAFGRAHYLMGQAQRRAGREREAQEHLRHAASQTGREPPDDDPSMAEVEALATGAIQARDRGIDLLRSGRVEEAMTLLEESIRINPDLAETHSQLGAACLLRGETDRAESSLARALTLDPGFVDAMHNLGVVAHRRGDHAAAIDWFRRAIEIRPDHADARFGLGAGLIRTERFDEAVPHLQAAIALRPLDARPVKQLAGALMRIGRWVEAEQVVREGVRRMPDDASIADRLAWLLATAPIDPPRRPAEALAIATRVVEVTRQREPRALETLAAALAACGRFDEAVATAERAARLAESTGDGELSAEIKERLQHYRAGTAPEQHAPARFEGPR